MESARARANAATLDAAFAAELARNNVGGPDDDTANANADEPPGPFDKLNKMDYKFLVRKCDIQYRMNRLVSSPVIMLAALMMTLPILVNHLVLATSESFKKWNGNLSLPPATYFLILCHKQYAYATFSSCCWCLAN